MAGSPMTPDQLLDRIQQVVEDENNRYRDLCDLVWAAICTSDPDDWPDTAGLVEMINMAFIKLGYPPMHNGNADEFTKTTNRKCPDPWNTYDEEKQHHA